MIPVNFLSYKELYRTFSFVNDKTSCVEPVLPTNIKLNLIKISTPLYLAGHMSRQIVIYYDFCHKNNIYHISVDVTPFIRKHCGNVTENRIKKLIPVLSVNNQCIFYSGKCFMDEQWFVKKFKECGILKKECTQI